MTSRRLTLNPFHMLDERPELPSSDRLQERLNLPGFTARAQLDPSIRQVPDSTNYLVACRDLLDSVPKAYSLNFAGIEDAKINGRSHASRSLGKGCYHLVERFEPIRTLGFFQRHHSVLLENAQFPATWQAGG